MFSNAAAHKFFFARPSVLYHYSQTYIENYVCYVLYVYSLPFCSFSFLPRAFSPFSRYFLFPLSRYKICWNANGGRNARDKIFALETRENLICLYGFGVEKTIVVAIHVLV